MSVMTAAGIFLGLGWLLGEFLLAPVHCGGEVCEAWAWQLRLATVSSAAGMGCLWLAAANRLPKLLLPIGAGVLTLTFLAEYANPGAFILVGVDFLLVMGTIGWLLVLWREG